MKKNIATFLMGLAVVFLYFIHMNKRCPRCRGTGHLCMHCGAAQDSCRCHPCYERCPDCTGIGRV